MKIEQIIADIHGRKLHWMAPAETKSILLGDYWDSFNVPGLDQVEAFYKWMEFAKKTNSICLMGNHDEHYLYLSPNNRCSGFQEEYKILIHNIMVEYKDVFKYAHYQDGILYTHAGVTEEYVLKAEKKYGNINDIETLVEVINNNNLYPNGYGLANSPLWLRPYNYYCPTMLSGIKQVVGHTYSRNTIRRYDNLYVTDIGRAISMNELEQKIASL